MRRLAIVLLVIIFCLLAYLEATAQEITTHTNVTNNTHTSTAESVTAKSDISQSINFGMAIIYENEDGKFTWVDKNIPDCDFTDTEHNYGTQLKGH